MVFGAVFSTVFSSFGGCGVSRLLGVRGFAGAALVRFIAGDAEPALPRADDDLRAPPDADDLADFDAVALRVADAVFRPLDEEADLRPAVDADLRAPEPDAFFAPVLAARRPLVPSPPPLRLAAAFASIALRSGEARSDFAYATS
jgi:hypothetical protein